VSVLRKAASLYLKSWLLLLWSGFCVCVGAAWMMVAIVGVLKMRGIL
jgi:hypothetical protein